MRRALAVMMLLVFSGPLFAPLLTASPDESSLPPCCRRNGKHHCMMAGMTMGMASPYRIVTEKCPYSPFADLALMLPHAFFGRARVAYTTQAALQALPAAQAEAGYRISFHRSRQKRGPPQQFEL